MKFHFGQTIKLSAKAREAPNQDSLNKEKKSNIENLIFYLTNLLKSWDTDKVSNDLQSDQPNSLYQKDLTIPLTTKINLLNAKYCNQFIYTIQFDIEKLKTYAWAMQGPHTAQWTKIIKGKLDQLYKNKT